MGAILSHSRKWQLQQRSTCGFLSFSPWPLPSPKLKLKLMLKLTHGFCMVTMEATILDTTATMVTMDMEVSGVARRGRLKLPPLLMLTLPLMLTLKLTHGFCMEATILEATILDTTVIMVLDMDMDLYGVARRGRPEPKLSLLLMLMPIPGCIMDMVVTMALVTTIEDGEATGGEDTDTGVD